MIAGPNGFELSGSDSIEASTDLGTLAGYQRSVKVFLASRDRFCVVCRKQVARTEIGGTDRETGQRCSNWVSVIGRP